MTVGGGATANALVIAAGPRCAAQPGRERSAAPYRSTTHRVPPPTSPACACAIAARAWAPTAMTAS